MCARHRNAASARSPAAGPLVLAALLALLGGCAVADGRPAALAEAAGPAGSPVPRPGAAPRVDADRLCAAHAPPSATLGRRLPPMDDAAATEARRVLATRGFSRSALDIAAAIGALRPLADLVALDMGAPGPRSAAVPPVRGEAASLRRLRLRQAVGDRILSATLDISTALAELDCEGERGDQLTARLQGIETRRARRMTLASILAGALTAGVSGGLGLAGQATAAGIAGIAGGATEASFAGSLLLGGATGVLRTDRNLLREIWQRPETPALFPETVWRYLRQARTGPDGAAAPSVADVLVAEWRSGDHLGPRDSPEERARIALVLGAGGTYGLDDLEAREAMIELVQASVALMSRDLRVLVAELEALAPP